MTGSYEASRGNHPNHINPDSPNIRMEQGNDSRSRTDAYRDAFTKFREDEGLLPPDSPCGKCVIGDPNQDAFFAIDAVGLPEGVLVDRLAECKVRYRKALSGLCGGVVQPPEEVIRQVDPLPDPDPTRFERFVQIINPLLQKMGLTIELLELPFPKPTPRLVVVQPPAHCGQDAPRYQQR